MNGRRFVLFLALGLAAWAVYVVHGARRRGVAADLAFKTAVSSYGRAGAVVLTGVAALLAWVLP